MFRKSKQSSLKTPKSASSLRKKTWDESSDEESYQHVTNSGNVDSDKNIDFPDSGITKSILKKKKAQRDKGSAIMFSSSSSIKHFPTKSSTMKKSNDQDLDTSDSIAMANSSSMDMNQLNDQPYASHYTEEYIEELKKQQNRYEKPQSESSNTDSFFCDHIPDATAIFNAKRAREKKRLEFEEKDALEKHSNDFISLSEQKSLSANSRESRSVTEDQDLEGEEVFDDHAGLTIAFPTKDRKSHEQLARDQMMELVNEKSAPGHLNDSDDEWERQQITKGSKSLDFGAKNQVQSGSPEIVIPECEPIPDLSAIVSQIESSIQDMELLLTDRQRQVDSFHNEAESLKGAVEEMETIQMNAAQRYEFYQKHSEFILNLASFLEEKMPILETLEQDIDFRRSDMNQLEVKTAMDGIENHLLSFTHGDTLRPELPDDDENDDIPMTKVFDGQDSTAEIRKSLLSDVSKHFSSLKPVQEQFDLWRRTYKRDYERSFAYMSLPSAFEIYIRHEMLSWDIFQDVIELETMNWHQILCGFGHDDGVCVDPSSEEGHVLVDIVEKHTSNIQKILVQFLDYVTIDSPAFLKVITALLDPVRKVVYRLEQKSHNRTTIPPTTLSVDDSRHSFFNSVISVFQAVISWKRFADKVTLQTWALDIILNSIVVRFLRESFSPLNDILHIEEIVQSIPKEWFENEYETPKLLCPLAECIEKTTIPALKSLGSNEIHRESAERVMKILVELRRYDTASILSKGLRA